MKNQPQNPEFRNNPENFTHVSVHIIVGSVVSITLLVSDQ